MIWTIIGIIVALALLPAALRVCIALLPLILVLGCIAAVVIGLAAL